MMSDFKIYKGELKKYTGTESTVLIPESVTSIGDSAFLNCKSLTNIINPESVTSIEDSAFCGCESLTNITIPESVTSIGDSAFRGCTSLTNITIPESVTSIGDSAFRGCTSLTSIIIPESVTSIGGNAFCDCENLTNITIPECITSIGYRAFCDCTSLRNITIPQSVTTIGDSAFLGCKCLRNITIPESVTSIEDNTFLGCKCLGDITIPKSVKKIGNSAFCDCESLYITIPKGVKMIGARAFLRCESSTCIRIPETVTNIGESAFKGCKSVTMITIPEELPSIEAHAFSGCTNITQIDISRNNQILADEDNTKVLISIDKNKKKFEDTGLDKVVERVLFSYNDVEVIFYADKTNRLDLYAKMHHTTVAALRDTKLIDFGLDENGSIIYDFGNTKIQATLNNELDFDLVDTYTGKTYKSIPKKLASDEEKYLQVKEEFTSLKKNVKNAVRQRADLLFDYYLNGRFIKAHYLKTTYLKNPLLRYISKLVVFSQDEHTFILSDHGWIDAEENSYTLSNSGVQIAHPFDMTEKDIERWREYFKIHHLKQLFVQVWEIKYNLEKIRKDRYKNCTVNVFAFLKSNKHGITHENGIKLTDCEFETIKKKNAEKGTFTFGTFKIKKPSRYSNHIVYTLDRWTIGEKIKQNDETALVPEFTDQFTALQVNQFLDIAIKADATNCTAKLLEIKKDKFNDYDSFDDMILEDF